MYFFRRFDFIRYQNGDNRFEMISEDLVDFSGSISTYYSEDEIDDS